jgi:hypothetical protein
MQLPIWPKVRSRSKTQTDGSHAVILGAKRLNNHTNRFGSACHSSNVSPFFEISIDKSAYENSTHPESCVGTDA